MLDLHWIIKCEWGLSLLYIRIKKIIFYFKQIFGNEGKTNCALSIWFGLAFIKRETNKYVICKKSIF